MKKFLCSAFLFLLVFSNLASAQSYFSVVKGIPHLAVMSPEGIAAPEKGMLIYSSTENKPMIYSGTAWESLCTNNIAEVAGTDYFMVKAGISYLSILSKEPLTGGQQGTIYYSSTQKSTMIHNGNKWVRIQDISASDFSEQKGFAAGPDLKTFRLPVLANNPPENEVAKGAFYLNALSKTIRYFDGTAWQDLRCSAEVLTLAVTEVMGSTATGGGNAISNGGYPITTVGICWSTNPNPDISMSTKTATQVTGAGTGIFEGKMADLLYNTTYHVRAYAINETGVVYGQDVVFKTGFDLPTIITLPVSDMTSINALSGGDISNDGGSPVTARGIRWSIKGDPLNDPDAILTDDGFGVGVYPSSLDGLLGNTTYYVRAYAVNSQGTVYGNLIRFTTPSPVAPLLSSATVSITNITDHSAKGAVNILNNGGAVVTSRGFAWSLERMTWFHGTSETVRPADIGVFIGNLVNLMPGTTYYAKGYATNSVGTTYTSETSFVTNSLALITTIRPNGNSGTTALSGGQISHNGGSVITMRGICWSTEEFPTTALSTKTEQSAPGDGTGSYSSMMKDLVPGVTYYIRAYAVNDVGTSYGNQEILVMPNYPVVTTLAASTFFNGTAKVGGNVLNDGGARVTFRGVCWSTTENPNLNSPSTSNGNGLGIFSSTMTGLLPNTLYHMRAYAVNSVGISYGEDKTFIIIPELPEVQTLPLTAVTNMTATGGGKITNKGGAEITFSGIKWSLSGDPADAADASKTNDGVAMGEYQSYLNNLLGNTRYYVRAYATNRYGTAYGELFEITTLAPQPPVLAINTLSIFDLTFTKASGYVSIRNNGGSKILSRGIAYSTDQLNYQNQEAVTVNSTDAGTYLTNLKDLIPGTVYYAKGYATNGVGTTYTKEMSFITPLNISLTTTPVSLITSHTAQSGGKVINPGSSGITYRGVCWSTSPNPTIYDRFISNGTTSDTFVSNLNGLTGSTRYYVRAYAGNNSVTVYGNEETFMTAPPVLAGIHTVSVSNIGGTTAQVKGDVADNGGSEVTLRGICWSATPDPTIDDEHRESGAGNGTFVIGIGGLAPLSKYYVRAYAINEVGVSYGEELVFTTATTATLTTLAPYAITANTATGGGNVSDDGGTPVYTSGICWSTAGLPTTADQHTEGGSGIGNFIHNINGLLGSTVYYVRAYAINSAGTAYGNVQQFTTAPPVPATLITNAASSGEKGITASSGGTITSNGGALITDAGLVWSTGPGFDVDAASTNRVSQRSSGSFGMTITGLQPGTTYYIRAFATNSAGISYAANEERVTTFGFPVILTAKIQNSTVTSTEAAGGGTITDNGGTIVYASGICWSTSRAPVITDQAVSNGAGMGSFVNKMTGLLGSTIYYVRAYAMNTVGIVYGQEESFTTLPPVLAIVTTQNAYATSISTGNGGGNILTNGGAAVTTRGLYWSTQPDFNPDTISLNKTAETGYFTGSFIAQLKGLSHNTTYYVRAYVVNSVGVSYGNTVSFITPRLPELTTLYASAVGSTSATSGGDITNEGGSAVYARGVVWSEVPVFKADTITVNRTSNGTRGGIFTSSLRNLKANTTYYVQSYATNVAGTGYGNLLSFITDPPVLAKLTTRVVTNVTGNTAISGGYISDNGGEVVTTRGLVWSTQSGFRPDTLAGNRTAQTGLGNDNFVSSIPSLLPGTTYYVRAYAINSVGVAYGNELNFTTLIVPTVTTMDVSVSSAGTTATSGGTIISDGGAVVTNQGLVWGTVKNPVTGTANQTNHDSGMGNTFRSTMGNLAPVTLYYVRAYATNSQGTAYGNEVTVTTPPVLATLSTTFITPSSKSTATTGGIISKDGGATITARGVVWSKDRNFNPGTETVNRTINGTGMGTFNSEVTNLALSTTYYVRAYAVNSVGTAYGNQVTVTLFPTAPVLSTAEVTALGGFTANSGGIITSDGGADITQKGLCWSTRANPTVSDARSGNGAGEDSYTGTMTGLQPNTLYYVRAYAINKIGVAYGIERTFLTNALPTLTVTTTVTNIGATTAISGGDITDDGRTPILVRGVTWNTTGNPTIGLNTKTIDNTTTGIGSFTSKLTGLADKTTYYVRAYATNGVGTTYGSQVSFTTLEIMLPTIFTNDPSNIGSHTATGGGDVIDDGGMPVTQRGICWSTLPNPTVALATRLSDPAGGTGNFSIPFTGLVPGTKYYIRAYAVNIKGIAYGQEKIFMSMAIPPAVSLPILSKPGFTNVDLSSTVVNNGGDDLTDRGFYWSTIATTPVLPFNADSTISLGLTAPFSWSLQNLRPGTKYYIWAYASNSAGTGLSSNPVAFTPPTLPLIVTSKANTIATTSARAGGLISSDGGLSVTARGLVWSTEINPTTDLSTKTSDGIGAGSFASNLNGLTKGTKYYIRAYATNSLGTAYGNLDSLTTLDLPKVTTAHATEIKSTTALSGGEVTSDGGATVTARGVCWSLTAEPTALLITKTVNGQGTGEFISNITGLTIATKYYFRAYVTNSIGTAYGELDSLTTPAVLATVTNVKVSGLTETTANIAAEVVNDGKAEVTERGFVWSTSSTIPTTADHKITDVEIGLGSFNGAFADLIESPTYYVRAYAVNKIGTAYSPEVSTFKICKPFTVIHRAGLAGAPSDKTITYKTISTNLTGTARCWITSNLGADQQATAVNDATDGSAGWYFQFNRSKGYEVNKNVRSPADNAWTPWPITNVMGDWSLANDPCNLLLGGGWRLPTATEWTAADAVPQDWIKDADAYNSVLKLHNAGYLSSNVGGITDRGVAGRYWSSSQNTARPTEGLLLYVHSTAVMVYNYDKTFAYPVRCLRDTIIPNKPMLTNVSIPNSGMTVNTAEGSATVVSDGGSPVTVRGLVWSTSNTEPAITDHVISSGAATGDFKAVLNGLSEGPTYYVRAFATNKNGTGYSEEVTSFKICNPFMMIHKAGLNGAPVDKTITYGTVNTSVTGAPRCWITQNLGADRQGTAAGDGTDPAAGWYYQFNRLQGYSTVGAVRTPNYTYVQWITSIDENTDWTAANDPCMLQLGNGWRMPTQTEWITADAPPQNWGSLADMYNSVLKLHGSGHLSAANATVTSRTTAGYFWTTSQNVSSVGRAYINGYISNEQKAIAMPVRCLRDEIVLSRPVISNVAVPVASMTVNAASGLATVTSNGGTAVTARGLVWSSTNTVPTIADNNIVDTKNEKGDFTGVMKDLVEGPTYYVRAYAVNSVGITYSDQVNSFKICNPFTVIHRSGLSGAPSDKTVTYKTISSNISGAARCWITQNLGAEQQATAVNDATDGSAGWYFQFNRSKGYEVNKNVRSPADNAWTPWPTTNVAGDWSPANDPCILLLGGGWRLPTSAEWTAADAAPQDWIKDADAYNSVLKLHNAGYLSSNVGGITDRGVAGRYWSSMQNVNKVTEGLLLYVHSTAVMPYNYDKTFAYPVRCLRDTIIPNKPLLTNVMVPNSGMTVNTAEGSATVASDGGSTIIARGLVWSTTNTIPTLADNKTVDGQAKTGDFNNTLKDLIEGPTYYVRAYATSENGTGYSQEVTSFKICNPFTMIHKAGLNGAPVDKTITYGTVNTSVTGAPRCWITQNLGADRQGTAAGDGTDPAAGWYYQFNRLQGYSTVGAVRTPNYTYVQWITSIDENTDWTAANDPCMLQLGNGWRMPTQTEWITADAPPQNWGSLADMYNSVLKLHGSGHLSAANATVTSRTTAGYFWTTAQNVSSVGRAYINGYISNEQKAIAMPVRCLRDEIVLSKPVVSNVVVPTATMTAATAGGSATISSDGGTAITSRGLVWSSTNAVPTIADNNIVDTKNEKGTLTGIMKGLVEGPTYYVRAYAVNSVGITYSPLVSSFKICNPFTVIHRAGLNGAPSDKTVTYKTISSNVSGAARCWITQNLGAEQQATAVNDATDPSAGWYFQFNRSKGYEVNKNVRSPADNAWTPWPTTNVVGDWSPANDPCILLLGGGWRLPTATEWTAADAAPQDWIKDADAYASELKIHNAGYLSSNVGGITDRGVAGRYWSSMQNANKVTEGWLLYVHSTAVMVYNYDKTFAYPVRCLRDDVIQNKPLLSSVKVPNAMMTVNTAEGSATVASDGGSPVTVRGLVWSTGNAVPTITDHVINNGAATGDFKAVLNGLSEGPTYYVRAFATNKNGTGYSEEVTSFKICNPFTMIHKAGLNGAPVDKTITYGTVNTSVTGAPRCWITQNLGADRQGTAAGDGTDPAAGWYYQFNRLQGYSTVGAVRTPNYTYVQWITSIDENTDWTAANDPCMLQLGNGWRMPTQTEWITADAPPQNWGSLADMYNSVLKLHGSGHLSAANATVTSRTTAGYFWTTSQNVSSVGRAYINGYISNEQKAIAMPVRCLRDEIVLSKPVVSNVAVPTATITANTAEGLATVTSNGATPITARGLVWSASNPVPTMADNNITDVKNETGALTATLNGLSEGPTYYVRAYAVNSVGITYSDQVNSFKICNPFTVVHKVGENGAPSDKTITYKTVSSNISGAARCWITQNLGAEQQATAVNDATDLSAGWYFQFNRSKGYEINKNVRSPADSWPVTNIAGDWLPANDPCTLLLGGGWRLPTSTEWTAADAAPQNWLKDADAYASELKIHNAGYLSSNVGGITERGVAGRYWSSMQNANRVTEGWHLYTHSTATMLYNYDKTFGYTVRCIRN